MTILEDKMIKIKQLLIIAAVFGLASCQPYVNTSLEVRQHLRPDTTWLGYNGPLHSNKITAVTTVQETGTLIAEGVDIDSPDYTLYVATEKGMQISKDQGTTWADLKWGTQEILGVSDICDDPIHDMIFIAAESGLYYKAYNVDTINKVESSGSSPLKKVDISDENFRIPLNQPRLTVDPDLYGVEVAITADGLHEALFLASTTGLYFSTDIFSGAPYNDATWGNVIGKNIITMDQKNFKYPQSTIPGSLSKWVTGEEVSWKDNEVNYDPIYDPVYNPTYNKNPDYYNWPAGLVAGKETGQPITYAEYATAKGFASIIVATDSFDSILTDDDRAEQRAARLFYETELEKNDYGNPNNVADGVLRIYPYYRDMQLKATRIQDVSYYNNVIHLAGFGSGVSYTTIDLTTLDSANSTTYDDEFIWETYMRNYFKYSVTAQDITGPRNSEVGWSVSSAYGYCITADDKGIFYGAENGGIGFAATYRSPFEVLDINGCRQDYDGNSQYILGQDSKFALYDDEHFPAVVQAQPNPEELTKEEIQNFYYRADKDLNDGVGSENLVQGLRLSWQEYTTSGWSVSYAPGETEKYQSPVLEFPNNNILKIRLGKLGVKKIIYIATKQGIGIAEIRKTYAFDDHVKITSSVEGTEQYSIDFVDWGEYHKDPTQVGEVNYVRDIAITRDIKGNDNYVYAATFGQGLVRFYWKDYPQEPLNIDLGVLGLGSE